MGLAPKLPVTENAVMREYQTAPSGPILNWASARSFMERIVKEFEVKIGKREARLPGSLAAISSVCCWGANSPESLMSSWHPNRRGA